MTTTKVSVVVPCYNGERFIAQTLESILSQTHENIEIIVVDDGSTDATPAIVQGVPDERVRYLRQENAGVSEARNLGLSKAGGRLVAFVDSDDLLTPDFLESRIGFLDSHPGFQGCCGAVTLIDEDGTSLPGEYKGAQDVEDVLLFRPSTITCPSNYVFRTSLLKQWDARFNSRLSSTADRYFLLDVLKHGKIGYVERGGALIYRYCSSSMSHDVSPPDGGRSSRFPPRTVARRSHRARVPSRVPGPVLLPHGRLQQTSREMGRNALSRDSVGDE